MYNEKAKFAFIRFCLCVLVEFMFKGSFKGSFIGLFS